MRSLCVRCGAPVIQATRIDNGEQILIGLIFETGWQLKYPEDDAYGQPVTGIGKVRQEHRCHRDDLSAMRMIQFNAIATKVGHLHQLFMSADAEIKPFEVDCPQCHEPPGEQCNNLSPGRTGQKTKYAHQARRDAGIKAQGYELVKIYGYQWIGKSEDVRKFLER